MPETPLIRLNSAATIRREPIADGVFCVVVDDFLADPDDVVAYACDNADAFTTPDYPYPGVRMDLSQPAVAELQRFVRSRLSREFGFLRGNIAMKCGLSMLTFPAEKLSNYQRLCHTDPREVAGRRKYAALAYLFRDERLGGTAFYRLKQPDVYFRALELELEKPGGATDFLAEHTELWRRPPQYMTESNEIAELLTVVPARWNRLVFYSGDVLHSGYITAPELLTDDLSTGRLTLNCFVSVTSRA